MTTFLTDAQLDRLARQVELRVYRQLVAALRSIRNGVPLSAIERALLSANRDAVLEVIGAEELANALHGVSSATDRVREEAFGSAGETINRQVDPTRIVLTLRAYAGANPHVLQAVQDATLRRIQHVTQQSIEAIRGVLVRSLTAGTPPYDTARLVKATIGLNPRQALAVERYRARLVADGREATQVERMVARYGDRQLNQRARVIATTECLPGDTVVDGAVVLAAFRRPYEGNLVEIRTAGGRQFSATPNHPMLTRRGWVPAGELTESDDLVCSPGGKDTRGSGDPDVQAPPTTIREVFDALQAVAVAERAPTRNPDFHGDGMEGEVDILRPARRLTIGHMATLYQPVVEQFLSPSDAARTRFCPRCRALLSIQNQPCLCHVPNPNPRLLQAVTNQAIGDAHGNRDGRSGFAAVVAPHDLVNVHVRTVPVSTLAGLDSTTVSLSHGLLTGPHNPSGSDDITGPVDARAGLLGDLADGHAGTVELDHKQPNAGASRRPVFAGKSKLSAAAAATRGSGVANRLSDPSRTRPDESLDLGDGVAAQVEFDRVATIGLRRTCDHVYNLWTPQGYFTAQGGIYTGNTYSALSEGKELQWKGAIDDGRIRGDDWEREWVSADDELVCPTCGSLHGVRADIGQPFVSAVATVMAPPAHPACRCVVRAILRGFRKGQEPSARRREILRSLGRRP